MLVLASGLIGFWADGLGRRLGKKRLTVFGLRPKHTATLGTVLLGFFVSSFTILAIFVLSKDVRTWILEGRQAIVEAQQEKAQLAIDRKRVESDQLQIGRLEAKGQSLANQLRNETELVQSEGLRFAGLQKQRVALQEKLHRTAEEVLAKSRLIRQDQVVLLADYKKLTENTKRLAQLTKQNRLANKARNESYVAQLKLDVENQDLTKQIGGLKDNLTDLEAQRTDLLAQLSTSRSDLANLKVAQAQETQVLSDLRHDEAALRQEVSQDKNFIMSVVEPSRTQLEIYAAGQEVTRLDVPDHLTKEEARKVVDNLLEQAKKVAEAKGAKSRGKYPVAGIFDQTNDSGNPISAQEIQDGIVADITGRPEPMVLIASSYLNQFVGEPVSLDVRAEENPTVFHKGEVVAESRIDGAEPELVVLRQVSGFLDQTIRTRARERRMIPRGVDDPFLVNLKEDDLLRAVSSIKSAGRKVWVQAVAIEDTRAADQLSLDLQVK